MDAVLTEGKGEEKKTLMMMLGKLYITPSSDRQKLQTALDLSAEAIDMKIASDAASRNALNKLHTALAKATGESALARRSVGDVTEAAEDQEDGAPEATEAGDDTRIDIVKEEAMTEAGETLEELLEEEEEL